MTSAKNLGFGDNSVEHHHPQLSHENGSTAAAGMGNGEHVTFAPSSSVAKPASSAPSPLRRVHSSDNMDHGRRVYSVNQPRGLEHHRDQGCTVFLYLLDILNHGVTTRYLGIHSVSYLCSLATFGMGS